MPHIERISHRTSTGSRSTKLGTTPLAQLMAWMERGQATGTLSIQVDEDESLILFQHGAPAKAYTPWPVPYLGVLLQRMGLLDTQTYNETLTESLRSGKLHGSVLLERALVSRCDLRAALREQTGLRILDVYARYRAASTFEFHADEDLLEHWGAEGTPVDPWRLLWLGSELRSVEPAAMQKLSVLGDSRVTVRRDVALHRFGFGPQELRAVQWIQSHPASIATLSNAKCLPADRMQTLLYVLFLTRCLAFPASQSERPGRPGASNDRFRQSAAVPRSGTMQRVSHPGSLPPSVHDAPSSTQPAPGAADVGLSDTPPKEQGDCSTESPDDTFDPPVRRSPSARKLHSSLRRIYGLPDSGAATRSAAPALIPASTRTSTSALPARPPTAFTPASRPATAPDQASTRASTPASTPETTGSGSTLEPVDVDALLHEAQEERRLGNLAEAEALARRALEARRSDPHVKTELAWSLALQPVRRQTGDLGEPLQLAKEAIKQNPTLDGPLCVQGIIYQALGMHEQAYRSFRRAHENNPRCVEAINQLDAYTARYRETCSLEPRPESARPSGLVAALSKLFKG